jgi:hypothetical protein
VDRRRWFAPAPIPPIKNAQIQKVADEWAEHVNDAHIYMRGAIRIAPSIAVTVFPIWCVLAILNLVAQIRFRYWRFKARRGLLWRWFGWG